MIFNSHVICSFLQYKDCILFCRRGKKKFQGKQHMYLLIQPIEVENAGCSGFEANLKIRYLTNWDKIIAGDEKPSKIGECRIGIGKIAKV